ncbi:DUF1428 domain-containing protein [Roseicyclus marinus]|uniref:DUF1428 domain-containing protein n=1 Tax=Roseicyclus marinus TaxID=2161673 RepID=A0AA48H224_9RHOB|nr:hypothetical protein MACH21_13060 [Roseicyclus marinus]
MTMTYVQGFLLAVPEARKDEYRRHAAQSWTVFQKLGCLRVQENWGVDVEPGKVTSFPQAVKLEPGEAVVFAWMIWPDKATHDAAWGRIMSEPELQEAMGAEMPFDGTRMMWGGFEPIFVAGAGG